MAFSFPVFSSARPAGCAVRLDVKTEKGRECEYIGGHEQVRDVLQKVLASHGVASRRASEVMIREGRVTVNGALAALGDRADPEADAVCVDGLPIRAPDSVYLMLYKPRGVVTTLKDEKSRRTARDCLPPELGYLVPVGRLDLASEGLLLFTNDGDCVQKLTHPSHEIAKTYVAWVQGDLDGALPTLSRPFPIDGVMTGAARVSKLADGVVSITIKEGKNRQVRRMCEQYGLHVTRLKRVSIGKLSLASMTPGQWRVLSEAEIAYIRAL